MDLLDALSLMFKASVALTVFCYGLNARPDDILHTIRRPRLLIVSLIAMFVVMPVVALALELYLDFPHATRVALVVLALTPIPALLARTAISSGGDPSYAYGLGFAVCLFSILIVPALIDFLGRLMSRPFRLDPSTVSVAMLTQVLLPLAVGLLVQRALPRATERIGEPLVKAANLLVLVACALLLLLVLPALLEVTTWRTVAGLAVFIAAGLGVGHVMGGPQHDTSITLAIACSSRNPGLAIGIATSVFPAEKFAATMILYAILVGVVTKPYIRWQQRRASAVLAQSGGSDGAT